MLGIVRLELYSSIGSYIAYLLISWVSGKHCVGMVPIPYLPAIVPYIPDCVVDRGSDSPVESSIVHLPSIGQSTTITGKSWLCSIPSLVISLCVDITCSCHDCQV
jgi:hypothetical protein